VIHLIHPPLRCYSFFNPRTTNRFRVDNKILVVQVIWLGYNKNDEESHGQSNENLA
jgi:hypothetical protein